MNTDLRKNQNMILTNRFFKLLNTAVSGKTMKNVQKYRKTSNNRKKKKLVGVRTKFS